MKTKAKIAALIGAFCVIGSSAHAGPGPDDDKLIIDGVEIVTEVQTTGDHPLDVVYSGWRFRTDETQALSLA